MGFMINVYYVLITNLRFTIKVKPVLFIQELPSTKGCRNIEVVTYFHIGRNIPFGRPYLMLSIRPIVSLINLSDSHCILSHTLSASMSTSSKTNMKDIPYTQLYTAGRNNYTNPLIDQVLSELAIILSSNWNIYHGNSRVDPETLYMRIPYTNHQDKNYKDKINFYSIFQNGKDE
ncbi:hypothetical protein H8356DRAFT_1349739 [Neocallimastix lanati (nom. inval.)]|nr:hypothetical protein H8356DRAFT_1349739 [Neocallimastix sp. JGI-2020a]